MLVFRSTPQKTTRKTAFMTYLTVDKLSKNYGLKTLFENLTFGLAEGDKTALIAPERYREVDPDADYRRSGSR